jgi:hypothetical protein
LFGKVIGSEPLTASLKLGGREDAGLLARTLWAIGVVSLVSAGMVFMRCLVPKSPNAQMIELNRKLPIVERFKRAGGDSAKGGKKAPMPLVEQAEVFASYLNPPKPKEVPAPRSSTRPTVTAVRPTKSTPKFALAATSYYQSRPEKSMGLVWEPGGGYRWIKQGERLGHFVVEEVGPGLIAYRNGDQLLEMAVNADITAITPEAGRTTVASSPSSTALFATANAHKQNDISRKAVPASSSAKSKARPTVNRRVAVQTRRAAPALARSGASVSRLSNSQKPYGVMRKAAPRPDPARPRTTQTSYDRRKNRA